MATLPCCCTADALFFIIANVIIGLDFRTQSRQPVPAEAVAAATSRWD
jgi:hypothetical protein